MQAERKLSPLKFTLWYCASFILLSLFSIIAAGSCQAAERHVLPATTSPDKKIAIVEERTRGGQRDYYFVQQSNGQKLGFVLAPEQRHEISNVAVVASWNRRSTKVALLVFYGTKLSELLLYIRADDGVFQQVEPFDVDPIAHYRKQTGRAIPQSGDGYSENALGPWFDDDTVMLVSGRARQIIPPNADTEDVSLDQYTHVFVTFRAHINGRNAKISDRKLFGAMTNSESEQFGKQWGEHYFKLR